MLPVDGSNFDFAACRRAADPCNWPAPVPLTPLSRAELLGPDCHLARLSRLNLSGKGAPEVLAAGGPGKSWSSARMESLERVELVGDGLRTDQTAKGKLLVIRIVGKASWKGAAHFVVEDRKGAVAPVVLHNVHPRWSDQQLGAIYRIGSCWAIKEPTIRSQGSGMYHILIHSPPDLVRLWPSDPLLALPFNSPPPVAPCTLSPLEHKTKGNALIERNKLEALEHYSLAIDQLTHPDPSSDPDLALLATLLSNRALVVLRLGFPGRALRDCELGFAQAGVPDAMLAKLHFRAASACYGMERWGDAHAHLEQVAALATGDKAAEALGARLRARQKEHATGQYDWFALHKEAESIRGTHLNIASHRHPRLEIQPIKDKHRGVIVTAPVRAGELLFVEHPIGSGLASEARWRNTTRVNLFTDAIDPPAGGEVVADLIERWVDREDDREQIAQLWAGEELGWLDSPYPNKGVDVTRLEAIEMFNSYGPQSLTHMLTATDAELKGDTPVAVYPFVSFLNHSCFANVAYTFLGDVIVGRARRDIGAGEEVTMGYCDGAEELEQRRRALEKYGFVCGCELCAMDEADGLVRRRQRQAMLQEMDGVSAELAYATEQALPRLVPRLRRLVASLDATHLPTRPALRPAMHSARAMLAKMLDDCGDFAGAIKEGVEVLRAVGVELAGEDLARLRLVAGPKVGEFVGVVGTLQVAVWWGMLGRYDAMRHWIGIARQMERCHAGEELFEARYGEWAKMNGFDLNM